MSHKLHAVRKRCMQIVKDIYADWAHQEVHAESFAENKLRRCLIKETQATHALQGQLVILTRYLHDEIHGGIFILWYQEGAACAPANEVTGKWQIFCPDTIIHTFIDKVIKQYCDDRCVWTCGKRPIQFGNIVFVQQAPLVNVMSQNTNNEDF